MASSAPPGSTNTAAGPIRGDWTPPVVMDPDADACTETYRARRDDGSGAIDQWQKQHIGKPKPAGPNSIEMRENWSHSMQRPAVSKNEEAVRYTQQVIRVALDGMVMRLEIQNTFGQSTNFMGPDFDLVHPWTTVVNVNVADYFAGVNGISATAPTAGLRTEHVMTQIAPPRHTATTTSQRRPGNHDQQQGTHYVSTQRPKQAYIIPSPSRPEQVHHRSQPSAIVPAQQPRLTYYHHGEPREDTPGLFVTPGPEIQRVPSQPPQNVAAHHRPSGAHERRVYYTVEREPTVATPAPTRMNRADSYIPPPALQRSNIFGDAQIFSPTPEASNRTRKRNTRRGGQGE